MKLQLQLNTESLKSTLKTYAPGLKWGTYLGLLMVMAFHSQDLSAAVGNDDKMEAAAKTLEGQLRKNAERALVGAGVFFCGVVSYFKQTLMPLGTGLGIAFGLGFAKSWIDSSYAGLI